jgi:hypothetical protein
MWWMRPRSGVCRRGPGLPRRRLETTDRRPNARLVVIKVDEVLIPFADGANVVVNGIGLTSHMLPRIAPKCGNAKSRLRLGGLDRCA